MSEALVETDIVPVPTIGIKHTNQSIERDLEITQIINLVDKDLKKLS